MTNKAPNGSISQLVGFWATLLANRQARGVTEPVSLGTGLIDGLEGTVERLSVAVDAALEAGWYFLDQHELAFPHAAWPVCIEWKKGNLSSVYGDFEPEDMATPEVWRLLGEQVTSPVKPQ